MWRGTMYQGKMSEVREAELKKHLQTKSIIKLSPETIQKIITTVNNIRTGIIKVDDWMPGLEDLVKYFDMLSDFKCEDFLTDEFSSK